MVKLFCAIVGVAGSAFSVKVKSEDIVDVVKDAIKQENPNDLKNVDADMLELFVTEENGVWLRSDDVDVVALRSENIPEKIKRLLTNEIDPAAKISKVFENAPIEDTIHVLVVVPPSNKKQRLEWQSTRWGSHTYDSTSRSFLLEKEDMDNSGLLPVRLMLYCRPTFHSQFEFMRKRVLNEGCLGWIFGPPGTGKSTTAMAFASSVDRSEWIVTWIHVDNNMKWRCIDDDTMHHLVLVDGWTPADTFTLLTMKCVGWFLEKKEVKQRLVFICSVAARVKVQEDMESVTRAKEFRVLSWTLGEYLEAIKDDEIFQSVSQCLDAPAVLPGDDEMSRAAKIESKYYYAGGSCRYMFQFRTATVKIKLRDAVDSLNDAATVATSGPRSSLSTTCLFGMFQRPHDVGVVSPVISQYAATLIAVRCSSETTKKLMSTYRDISNPVLNGWMLEMVFFASLQNGGLDLVDAAGNKLESWNESAIVVSDAIPALSSAHPIWIKPEKWNQGGYDAIMVCKHTHHVRFVQVTSAHKHSFRIEHFYEWLKKLSGSPDSFEVKKLELIFVVEQDKLSTFNFTTVTGDGLLEPFGWPKGKETDSVWLVGIRKRDYPNLAWNTIS